MNFLIQLRAFRFTVASCVGLCACVLATRPVAAQPAGPAPRYQWKNGQTFAYEMNVTADNDEFEETLQGTIWYTVVTGQGEQLKVTFNGGLNKVRKNKAGRGQGGIPFGPRGGPPGFGAGGFGPFGRTTMGGLTHSTNEIVLTPRGQVQSLKGSSQLPYLLGNLSLLIFEPLPENSQRAWAINSGVSITEGGRAGGPPFFGSPFAPKPEEKSTSGSEATSFAVERDDANSLVTNKTYKLTSPAADANSESFEINGTGKWTFNRQLGISESLDFQQKLTVRQGNSTTTIPMTIKYRRLSDAEVQKIQEETKKRTEEAQTQQKMKDAEPLDAKERSEVLANLKSTNDAVVVGSLFLLGRKTPSKPDDEIAAALQGLLNHKNGSIKQMATDAMIKFSPPEAKAKIELIRKFAGPAATDPTNRPVTAKTKLQVGQILIAHNTGAWYPVEILTLLPDGRVELHFRGWGDANNKILPRDRLQLAPDELDQPNIKAAAPAVATRSDESPTAEPKWHTWSDDSGKFKIEGVFVALEGGKVKLRRKDGKEVSVPLDRLSKADRDFAAEQAKEPTNPFEP